MDALKECCVAVRVLSEVPGLGVMGLRELYGEYGGWGLACEAKGLGRDSGEWLRAEEELRGLIGMGGWCCCLGEGEFPKVLTDLADGPVWLSGLGGMDWGRPMVAVVGSRNCSEEGLAATRSIVRQLVGAGMVVVSGMALGIDRMAHRAALEAGGQTVAVWGCGLARAQGGGDRKLFGEIANKGCHVSQFSLGLEAQRFTFPVRNKVIAGLCRAVIVVEASRQSGSLLTAEAAREYGRQVLAVPGSVFDGRSRGTNWLIEQGADIVVDVNDIVGKLGLGGLDRLSMEPGGTLLDLLPLSPGAQQVLGLLESQRMGVDELVRATGLGVSEVAGFLLELELSGRVRRVGEVYVGGAG